MDARVVLDEIILAMILENNRMLCGAVGYVNVEGNDRPVSSILNSRLWKTRHYLSTKERI